MLRKSSAIAAVLVAALALSVGGRSDAANPPAVHYVTGVVFTQGFGLYITNNTGSTQKATVVVRSAADTVLTPVSEQGDLTAIPAHGWAFQGYGCGGPSSCPLTIVVTTHSSGVVPSLDNDPPGTVTNEELPAGVFQRL